MKLQDIHEARLYQEEPKWVKYFKTNVDRKLSKERSKLSAHEWLNNNFKDINAALTSMKKQNLNPDTGSVYRIIKQELIAHGVKINASVSSSISTAVFYSLLDALILELI